MIIAAAAILKNGVVYTGRRHGEIIAANYKVVGHFKVEDTQGFVTDEGKFVNRQDAGIIAFNANQTKEHHQTLYSEDLW
jgi:hypothetical protein